MADPIVEAYGLPVNAAGEIVAIAGSGDTVVVGTLNPNNFPIDVATKKLIISGLGAGGGMSTIAFASVIPLSGSNVMATKIVDSAITFTKGAVSNGGSTIVELIANGVNVPVFTAFEEHSSNMGYVNTAGYTNIIEFFVVGTRTYYSVSQPAVQIVAAVPSVAITMTGPTTGISGSASTAFTVAFSPAGSTPPATTMTFSDGGAGGTFSPTTRTSAGTFTYTASSAGAKTISLTNNAGLTNPGNITYTASASDTTAPVIQSAAINGGTLVMTYNEALNTTSPTLASFSLSLAGGAGAAPTAAVVSGSTVTLTFATAATNGQSAALTYTPGAAPIKDLATTPNSAAALTAYVVTNNTAAAGAVATNVPFRVTGLNLTETGDATVGYTYTGSNASGYNYNYGTSTLSIPAGQDGAVYLHNAASSATAYPGGPMIALKVNSTAGMFSTYLYALYGDITQSGAGTGFYKLLISGVSTVATVPVAPALNDKVEIRRTGSTITFLVNGVVIHTITNGSTAALYPTIAIQNTASAAAVDTRGDNLV